MNLQYISDNQGKITGVFIPIQDWNYLKRKFKEIEKEETDVPQWQQDLVKERLEDYSNNPVSTEDFDSAIDDIEKDL